MHASIIPAIGGHIAPPEIHTHIHSHVNVVIDELENRFLSRTDFREDFIMQNALLKNLPIRLTSEETKKLEEASLGLKKKLNTPVLKTALDFTHETPAQRIAKLQEIQYKLLRG